MAVGWSSRLAALLLLLLFQILNIVSDIVFFRTKPKEKVAEPEKEPLDQKDKISGLTSWVERTKRVLGNPDIRQSAVPLFSVVLGTIIVSVIFSGASDTFGATEKACGTNLDADVSGDGVRVSFWAQIGVLIIISAIGFFHPEDTGIKEVGSGLILTHVSLVVALIVQMRRNALTSVDAAIGAAILDAQNVALQIPLTAKQALAARWQVIILIPVQILGLAVLPTIVVGLGNGNFASADCECLLVFWWSWISSCRQIESDGLSLFWVYYVFRWIMVMQSSFHAIYNAEWFHRSEKSERQGCSQPVEKATIQSGYSYATYPATISLSCMMYALCSLTSMAVAEVTIREYNLQASSDVYSIGQIIAIVIAGATIIRAAWSFQSLFNGANTKSFPDLVFTLLWSPWRCFRRSRKNEEGIALISKKRDETKSGFHGRNDGSRRSPSMEPPATGILPKSRPLTQTSQRLQTCPGSPRSSPENSSFDDNIAQPSRIQSFHYTDDRVPNPAHRQKEQKFRQGDSYGPRYKFELRQPFHLDAAKQIYFPTLSQYFESRSRWRFSPGLFHDESRSPTYHSPVTVQDNAICEPAKQDATTRNYEITPLNAVPIKKENYKQASTPEDHGESSASSNRPTRTHATLDTENSQAVAQSAVPRLPKGRRPQLVPFHTVALHETKEDQVGNIPSTDDQKPSIAEPTSSLNQAQIDTKLQAEMYPATDMPAGVQILKKLQREPPQNDNPLSSMDEEDVPDELDCEDDIAVSVSDVQKPKRQQQESSLHETSLPTKRVTKAGDSDCGEPFIGDDDMESIPEIHEDIEENIPSMAVDYDEHGPKAVPDMSDEDDSQYMAEDTLGRDDLPDELEEESLPDDQVNTIAPRDGPHGSRGFGKRPVRTETALEKMQDLARTASAQPEEEQSSRKIRGLRLLSLGDGYIYGLSTLYALKSIMNRLNKEPEGDSPRKPCEVFDLIGGSGTGGLIAILIGRLELSVDESIAAYIDTMRAIPSDAGETLDPDDGAKDLRTRRLRAAIDKILDHNGVPSAELFNDGVNRQCRTFVQAVGISERRIFNLREYDYLNEPAIPMTICDAILATLSDGEIFTVCKIGYRAFMNPFEHWYDEEAANPVEAVDEEANKIWCSKVAGVKPPVDCLLFIRPCFPHTESFGGSQLGEAMEDYSFRRRYEEKDNRGVLQTWAESTGKHTYLNLEIEGGLDGVGFDEWNHSEAVAAIVEEYLNSPACEAKLRKCVQRLQLGFMRTSRSSESGKIVGTMDDTEDAVVAFMKREPENIVPGREVAGKAVVDDPGSLWMLPSSVRDA